MGQASQPPPPPICCGGCWNLTKHNIHLRENRENTKEQIALLVAYVIVKGESDKASYCVRYGRQGTAMEGGQVLKQLNVYEGKYSKN